MFSIKDTLIHLRYFLEGCRPSQTVFLFFFFKNKKLNSCVFEVYFKKILN